MSIASPNITKSQAQYKYYPWHLGANAYRSYQEWRYLLTQPKGGDPSYEDYEQYYFLRDDKSRLNINVKPTLGGYGCNVYLYYSKVPA